MPKGYKVSQSKVNAWRACHRKHYYRFVMGIVRKIKRRPLTFGSIVHKMLEEKIQKRDPFKYLAEVEAKNRKLFAAEEEMYGNIIKDVGYIMRGYFEYWDRAEYKLEYIKTNGKFAEHAFEVEADNGNIIIKGKMDARVKAKGMKWLLEHKSHKNFPSPDERWRNLQSVVYVRVNDMLGWDKLDGTLWDYIRSKPPTVPQVLKDGSLSTRSIDTLPQVILDTAKEKNLPKSEYIYLLTDTQKRLGDWYQRVFTPVKKNVVDMVWADFIHSSREMAEGHGKVKDRNIGKHCSWCDYEPLCRAALQGHDSEMILKREYVKEDEWEYLDGENDN